jgi:hypothetical protein
VLGEPPTFSDLPRGKVGDNPERSYWTVLPTSECEIEVPGIGLSSRRSLPPPPPQAVNPRIANATASAPAVTLRDLEVVCRPFVIPENPI